jgi:hypothetical protein
MAATLLFATAAGAGAATAPSAARASVVMPAGQQLAAVEPPLPSTTIPPDETQVPIPRIIPLPNSGHKPADPGDPGGFLQVSLFFFICGAIVLLVGLAFLDGWRKKHRRDRAGMPQPTATGSARAN